MFAAKATARRAARLRRNFATVVDTAGFKLAAVDNGQPTSAVTFLIKAGSRYEPKPGLSHVLKNFAFKVCLMLCIIFKFSHILYVSYLPLYIGYYKALCSRDRSGS